MSLKDRARREIVKLYLKRYIARLETRQREHPSARIEMNRYLGTTILDGLRARRPVIWTTYSFPMELITAYSLVPYFSETGSAVITSLGYGGRSLEITEKLGYGRESCTYHRATMGAAFEGYLPRPDILVGCSHLCDGQAKMMESIADHYGKPCYLLDVPNELDADSIMYVREQLADLESVLAEIIGRRIPHERFAEVIDISNQTRREMIRVNELRRSAPSPMSGRWAFGFIFQALLGMGSTKVLEIYRNLVRELEAEITGGGLERQEHRVLWLLAYPYFKHSFVDYMESELGLFAVADEMSYIYWDEMSPDDPLGSLAKKTLQNPGLGEVSRRVDVAVKLAVEHKVEGAIHYSHFGCRQGCGGVSALREGLESVGVPLLVLDGDCIDERDYSDGQVRTRLEGFCEMLEDRRLDAVFGS